VGRLPDGGHRCADRWGTGGRALCGPLSPQPSQVQQSLHRRHFSHKWFAQASRVQRGQIFSEGLSQM